jgi:hypothetical protein
MSARDSASRPFGAATETAHLAAFRSAGVSDTPARAALFAHKFDFAHDSARRYGRQDGPSQKIDPIGPFCQSII